MSLYFDQVSTAVFCGLFRGLGWNIMGNEWGRGCVAQGPGLEGISRLEAKIGYRQKEKDQRYERDK